MTGRSMRRGWGDLALAVIVVAVVAMMVVPLPALAIDLLLAMSFTSAVVILLTAVYAPSPARLTTLPTILLVATLFRLGVNVSTTRRILAEGDGGQVVRAFGDFVAQGELVVGLVVFGVSAFWAEELRRLLAACLVNGVCALYCRPALVNLNGLFCALNV